MGALKTTHTKHAVLNAKSKDSDALDSKTTEINDAGVKNKDSNAADSTTAETDDADEKDKDSVAIDSKVAETKDETKDADVKKEDADIKMKKSHNIKKVVQQLLSDSHETAERLEDRRISALERLEDAAEKKANAKAEKADLEIQKVQKVKEHGSHKHKNNKAVQSMIDNFQAVAKKSTKTMISRRAVEGINNKDKIAAIDKQIAAMGQAMDISGKVDLEERKAMVNDEISFEKDSERESELQVELKGQQANEAKELKSTDADSSRGTSAVKKKNGIDARYGFFQFLSLTISIVVFDTLYR